MSVDVGRAMFAALVRDGRRPSEPGSPSPDKSAERGSVAAGRAMFGDSLPAEDGEQR